MQSKPKLSAWLLVVLEILLCIIIYLAFLCIRRRRRRLQQANQILPQALSDDNRYFPAPAQSRPIVLAIVVFSYSALEGLSLSEPHLGNLRCAACVGELKGTDDDHDDETLRLVRTCGHVFHAGCVDESRPNSCPCCSRVGPSVEDVVVVDMEEHVMIKLPEEVREKITDEGKLMLPNLEPCPRTGFRS